MLKLNYSLISKLVQCPHRYEMEMVTKPEYTNVPLFLGSTFHLAIKMYHESRLANIELSEDEVLQVFSDFWQRRTGARGQAIQWGKEKESNHQQMGLELISAYYPYAKDCKPKIVEEKIVKEVMLDNGQVIVVDGIIDLITDKKMIDYKTAGMMPFRSEVERSIQSTIYLFLLGHIIPFEYHYVMKRKEPEVKIFSVEKTDYDLHFLEHRLFPYVVAMLNTGLFPPFGFVNASCRWCPLDGKC